MTGSPRIEVLKCTNCYRVGLAELSDDPAPFQGQADLIPAGFKAVPDRNGAVRFFCVDCNLPVSR
jgi:hypothetical protein